MINYQSQFNHLTQFTHLTNESIKNNLIMQNKPNFPENQVNASSVLAKGYEADIVFWPKNPKANLPDTQMNVNKVLTKDYENKHDWTLGENKPNSNPIKAKTNPIQTQYKAKQTQTNPKPGTGRGAKYILTGSVKKRIGDKK